MLASRVRSTAESGAEAMFGCEKESCSKWFHTYRFPGKGAAQFVCLLWMEVKPCFCTHAIFMLNWRGLPTTCEHFFTPRSTRVPESRATSRSYGDDCGMRVDFGGKECRVLVASPLHLAFSRHTRHKLRCLRQASGTCGTTSQPSFSQPNIAFRAR